MAKTPRLYSNATALTPGIVTTEAQTFGGVKTFQDPPVIFDASGIVKASASDAGIVTSAAQTFGGVKTFQNGIILPTPFTFRNKIINGDMRISQKYTTGKRTSPAASAYDYTVDRWSIYGSVANSISGQQLALTSSDAPFRQDGLTYYIRANKESTTVTGSDIYILQQAIEGQNIADLKWGTAYSKTVTVSFWARSSVSANYSFSLCNKTGGADTTYVSPFDTTSTWKKYTIVVPGPSTGTWLSDNNCGISVRFVLGGSGVTTVYNQWKSDNNYVGGTTQFSTLAQNSSLDITGVQLEVGSVASPFEFRPIGTEVSLCQRYFEKSYSIDAAVASNTNAGLFYHLAASDGSSNSGPYIQFKATKRGTVSLAGYTATGASGWVYSRSGVGATTATNLNTTYLGPSGGLVYIGVGASWVACSISGHWAADSEIY